MKKSVRWLSALLCVVMVLGLLPAGVSGVSANSTDKFGTAQLDIANEKTSTLAPGINQDAYTLYNNKGEQVKMFVTTADMSVDTVKLFASYKDMDPTNYGMSKLTEQVDAFNKKAAAGDEYYQGTVVAGINASYYNMITGKPTGTFVMNGIDVTTESEGNAYGYFAVMKDGSVKIGNKGDYSKDKGNIQEAIGIYTMLIVDGKICSGLNTTQYYPRQTIGITADGDVILMTADGNQAPKSIGLTVQEQAQVMLDLGCVWAGHLDGGGSCTYAAKAEGSDDFVITNSPSDGSERSVSNGFLIVSTAAASYTFDHVVYDVENDYLTPGSSVKVSMSGVSSTGNAAEIPAGITYVADNGTIVDGVFTAGNTMGNATITAMYEGKAVGQTVLNVVAPDAISFANATMTVPFGKTVALKLEATYGAKSVTINPANIDFKLSDSSIGTINGFNFTAGAEGVAATSATLTATLTLNPAISAAATVKLGKGSEVVFDFEDNTNQTIIFDETPGTQYNYVWPETQQQVVTSADGKVHGGNYALGMHVNYSNNLESGYMKTSLYSTETKIFKGAVRVGCWIYIPDECVGLWARWTLNAVTYNTDDTPVWGSAVNGNTMDTSAGGTGVVYTFCEPGWHYLYVDTSSYEAVGWRANTAMMQFYISDRDGADYGYVASQNSNIPSNYQFYLDDVTVDYSSAVDDREAPVISNVTYAVEGMPDAAILNGQTVTSNKVTFGASVAEYTGKDNYTGVNPATVKAYIDGVEVAATYANGLVSVTDVSLTNGKHTIKFSVCDYMGNYSSIIKTIVVNAAQSGSTVKLVPADPSANRILLSSIYNMNLVATAIEEVDSVTVVLDLDNNSTWQLDHMILANGFSAEYTVDEKDNIATITITRTGSNTTTGEAVLATLPVRVWTLKTGYVYPNGTKVNQQAYTLAQFKSTLKEFWRMSVITNVDMGILTRVDGTSDTFTGERVFCDTEMWGNFAVMDATAEGKAYYNSWNGGHVHTAQPIADKAATCAASGYTGRTYCAVCDSVVEWGTTVSATGHSYAVTDGVLQCQCGEKFNGVYTDGKTYVDGVVIADGWSGESYYVGGEKLTGLQEIEGVYYDFGTEGVCPNKARVDGFYFDTTIGAYRYFTAGQLTTGEVSIYPEVYFYDANGVAVSGEVDVLGYKCYFDEKGAFVSSEDDTVVDAGFSGTNIQYVLLSSGLLKVNGEGVMKDYQSSGLYPAWVTQNDATTITALEVGNGITKIGRFGFYKNVYLKSVTFQEGSSLKTIGWGAFGHNWRLSGNVEIPASVEVLEGYAFYECGALQTVTFQEGSQLKSIGNAAFYRARVLEKIYIPEDVTTMEADIFDQANADVVLQVAENSVGYLYAQQYKLKTEVRPGTVKVVKSGELSSTVSWKMYSDGVLEISGTGAMPNFASHNAQPWYSSNGQITKIVIGKDITAVGNYAFCYAQNVTEIVFEEGSKLESIGVLSFHNLPKVTSVTLPETVASISAYGFGDCFGLEYVYIPQGTGYIYSNAFSGSSKVVLNVSAGTYAEDFAKKNGVKYEVRDFVYIPIASGNCGENVQWAMYENGELWITGSGAMVNYASHNDQPWYKSNHLIKRIVIGKDITAVGNYAFCYAQNVTEIVFEEGSKLEQVGILSFHNLPKVTSVTLPETVTSISAYGFGDCFGLEYVYIPQGTGYIYSSAFNGSSKVVLSVSAGTYAEDFAKKQGIKYETREFVYNPIAGGSCGVNAQWAMYENGELWITGTGAMVNYASHNDQPWYKTNHLIKRIVIGKDITAVGNYAFCYAQNVTEVVFEEGSKLEKVGILSFHNLPKVTSVTLPETVTYIGAYGFGDCFGLENLYVPQSVSNIYKTAFTGSSKLVLNVSAGTYAEDFAKQYGVKYVTRDFVYAPIASGNCGENAQWAMYENGELWITGSGEMVNFNSHKDQPWYTTNHKIKRIVIGKDITAIGNYTFCYAQNVTEIVFEEGSKLEKVGILSFMNLPSLTKVVLPETVTFINAYAFGDCYGLTEIYIPAGVTYIHNAAFSNCGKLTLNVASGSYAMQYAKDKAIAYTVR